MLPPGLPGILVEIFAAAIVLVFMLVNLNGARSIALAENLDLLAGQSKCAPHYRQSSACASPRNGDGQQDKRQQNNRPDELLDKCRKDGCAPISIPINENRKAGRGGMVGAGQDGFEALFALWPCVLINLQFIHALLFKTDHAFGAVSHASRFFRPHAERDEESEPCAPETRWHPRSPRPSSEMRTRHVQDRFGSTW